MIQPPTLNLGLRLLVSGYIHYKFWTLPLMVSSSLLNRLTEKIINVQTIRYRDQIFKDLSFKSSDGFLTHGKISSFCIF